MQTFKKWKIILKAGLIAGLLDIIAALFVYVIILNLTTSLRVLQTIAAGALGDKAYSGGWPVAALGLLFHFIISIIFAGFYMLILPYWKRFFGNPLIAGICYGCLAWSIMNLLVLPGATGKLADFNLKFLLIGISLVILCIGIPIAVITEKCLLRHNALEEKTLR